MIQVIYKTINRDIVAFVSSRDTPTEETRALEAKMENILENANLGGVREDYGVVTADHKEEEGKEIAIDENLQVVFVDITID